MRFGAFVDPFVLNSRFVHMLYPFSIRFIGSMIHTGNIHLADDFTYIYGYCIYQRKINRYTQASLSVTADFCVYRLFSRFSRLAAPEAAHLELYEQKPACSSLNY